MAKWEERRDAKTSVLASDATLQLAIFHLTASGGGALLTDERVGYRSKPKGLRPHPSHLQSKCGSPRSKSLPSNPIHN